MSRLKIVSVMDVIRKSGLGNEDLVGMVIDSGRYTRQIIKIHADYRSANMVDYLRIDTSGRSAPEIHSVMLEHLLHREVKSIRLSREGCRYRVVLKGIVKE